MQATGIRYSPSLAFVNGGKNNHSLGGKIGKVGGANPLIIARQPPNSRWKLRSTCSLISGSVIPRSWERQV